MKKKDVPAGIRITLDHAEKYQGWKWSAGKSSATATCRHGRSYEVPYDARGAGIIKGMLTECARKH